MEGQRRTKSERFLNFSPYEHPGKITNVELIKNGNFELTTEVKRLVRRDIVEYYDYVCVDGQTWKYLFGWYGVDFCLIHFNLGGNLGEKIRIQEM